MLINRTVIKLWVESFLNSEESETDRHIEDFTIVPIPKSGWIICAFNIFDIIKEYYPSLQVIVLIHQKCRSKNLCSVKSSLLRGLYTPPSIILYKGELNSILFDDVTYSNSISIQFNMNAYVRNDNDEWDVFLTELRD